MESNGNEGHGAAPDTKKPGASIGANNTPPTTAAAAGSTTAKSTKDDAPATTATPTPKADGGANKSPRKRRKVNHGMSCSAVKSGHELIRPRVPTACLYCRRSVSRLPVGLSNLPLTHWVHVCPSAHA